MHFSFHAISPLLLTVLAAQAQTQDRKPSTPEDRTKAVAIARSLEADPLGPQAKEQRNWVVHWLMEVPDINVKVCGNLVGPVFTSKKNYAAEIFTQMLPSAAAFIIEHPEKGKDDAAVFLAATEGALRAYESILKAKPKAKWPFLDELLEKRSKGELKGYVEQASGHCK